jgi:hypothetical protein
MLWDWYPALIIRQYKHVHVVVTKIIVVTVHTWWKKPVSNLRTVEAVYVTHDRQPILGNAIWFLRICDTNSKRTVWFPASCYVKKFLAHFERFYYAYKWVSNSIVYTSVYYGPLLYIMWSRQLSEWEKMFTFCLYIVVLYFVRIWSIIFVHHCVIFCTPLHAKYFVNIALCFIIIACLGSNWAY